eukprot:TRINITY_DN19486_c1_g3_i1.p1 TRINITY_DN19486_c1_g3~~TRINITY_DN19486_c1_g3_i1.p1  ORF type:complete len:571 (-),score=83.34 TRINITY_DN19486_c1_g3_i1:88-1752(-)
MANKLAASRLRKELAAFHANPLGPRINVACDEWNILSWSYLLQGPAGTPYEGGWYWGKLQFPENYPLTPPSVTMRTPSGRFKSDARLCLSVSDYHPENWKPALGFATVLEGLLTFMVEDTPTVGSVDPLPSVEERRNLASASMSWNREHAEFVEAFPNFEDIAREALATNRTDNSDDMGRGQDGNAGTNEGSDEPAEQIPPEFVCSICIRVLCEPVSVSCGHTFCRACLNGTLDYRSLCPLCQAPLTGGQSVNIIVQELVAQQCPKALAARKEEVVGSDGVSSSVDRRAPSQPRGEIIPIIRFSAGEMIFPSSSKRVKLPNQSAVAAIDHALRGSRKVGIFGQNADLNKLGCCTSVREVHRARPGTAAAPEASLFGDFRFRLLEDTQWHADGFELGRVEPVHDLPLPESELALDASGNASATSVLGIANNALDLIDGHVERLGAHGRHVFQASFGTAPLPTGGDAITTAAVERLSFWLAGTLAVPAWRQERWLSSQDTRERLEECRDALQTQGLAVLNLPGTKSWMNAGTSGLNSIRLLIALVVLLVAKFIGVL